MLPQIRARLPVRGAWAERPSSFRFPQRGLARHGCPGTPPRRPQPGAETRVFPEACPRPARRQRSRTRASRAGALWDRPSWPVTPKREAAGGAALATPNNKSKEKQTPTCGCVFLNDSVLCAILKCLLYFSICSSPEYCRSLELLGSRCKCVEAGEKNDIPESQGELKRSCLGTERPLGSKVVTVGLGAATRSVPQPQRRPVAGQPLRQPQL